jgi:hypothetical protein
VSSDDHWRKQEERRKRDAYYDALRDRDPDKLVRAAASTQNYLHYLKTKDAPHDAEPLTQTFDPVEEKKKVIAQIMTCSRLDLAERFECCHWVEAIDPLAADADLKIIRMRGYLNGIYEGYLD